MWIIQSTHHTPIRHYTVLSINTAEDGHNISCAIKDEENATLDIYVNDANIICTTGQGWLILHEKDFVKVFYQKDERTDDGALVATSVYILRTAQ